MRHNLLKTARRTFRRAFLLGPPLCFLVSISAVPAGGPKGRTRIESKVQRQDAECLACHGQPSLKSEAGKDLSINIKKHAASVHGILGCRDCHTAIKEFPHPAKIPRVPCSACHAEASADFPKSVHSALGEGACQACHGSVHEIGPAAQLVPGRCAECHTEEVKEFQGSVHGEAAKARDPDAPTCFSCHGAAHRIAGADDPSSPVARKNLADTCATCHSNPDFLSRHRIPVAHPVEQYKQSVHGRAVAAGKIAATCSDCHSSHAILPARDARSTTSHWNVAETCGKCHSEIAKTYLGSVHGQAMQAGARDAPVCTDCHGEHLILGPKEAESPVSAARVSLMTCGRCHGDERLAQRYNLPADRVPSYADSYHGLAMREGSQAVANCASCHGVHDIYPSRDPRSRVNAANLSKTCGACHAGAGEKFAIGPVHVQISTGPAHPVVRWIRRIYWVLIPLTLLFMVLHNLVDLLAKLVRRRPRVETAEQVVRMNLYFRIAHWGVMLSFPALVVTGFALKYGDSWWARPLLLWESRFAFRGAAHRIAAVVLLAAAAYHFVHLSLNRRDRAFLKAILPKVKDLTDLLGVARLNLGLTNQEPKFGKFNYAEKLEYWAFLWGTAVMGISGFLLWFNNFTLRHFPKWMADAAIAVHWYEALLATFSILLWHFYMVIFDPVVYPMDLAWLNGKVPADHYRHSRPQYFCALDQEGSAGSLPEPVSASSSAAASENQSKTLPPENNNGSAER